LGLLGLAGYLAAYAVVVAFLGKNPDETFQTGVSYPPSTRLLLLVAGAHTACFEEAFFSGYPRPALMARLGAWAGLIVTAIIFAAWHPPYFDFAGFLVRLGWDRRQGCCAARMDRWLLAPFIAHALIWRVVGLAWGPVWRGPWLRVMST
jgi:membrane protease YdiL (CAAX protease family)